MVGGGLVCRYAEVRWLWQTFCFAFEYIFEIVRRLMKFRKDSLDSDTSSLCGVMLPVSLMLCMGAACLIASLSSASALQIRYRPRLNHEVLHGSLSCFCSGDSDGVNQISNSVEFIRCRNVRIRIVPGGDGDNYVNNLNTPDLWSAKTRRGIEYCVFRCPCYTYH